MLDVTITILFLSQIIGWGGLFVISKFTYNYENKIKKSVPQPEIYKINWNQDPKHLKYEQISSKFSAIIVCTGIPLIILGFYLASQDYSGCEGRFTNYC